MSDVGQGEGWWVASDGKWYPPELHPSYAPPPPPPLPSYTPPPLPRPPPAPSPNALATPGPPLHAETAHTAWYQHRWVQVTGGVLVAVAAISVAAVDDGDDGAVLAVGPTPTEAIAATPADSAPTVAPAPSATPAPATVTPEPDPSPSPTSGVDEAVVAVVAAAVTQLDGLTVVDSYSAAVGYVRFDYQGDGWSDLDGDCVSTRHEVLAAESLEPVVWSANGCFVESGFWIDAWSGEEIRDASAATVDHVVALFHAHDAGAWEWDSDTKQRFTNDTHPQALNIVSQATNTAKDASGPSAWRPPLKSTWCAYALDWITTKSRWGLSTTISDRDALAEMIATCNQPDSDGPRTETLIDPADTRAFPLIGLATPTPVPPTPTPVPVGQPESNCDPNYSGACIPVYPPDVNCGDVSAKRFRVTGRDVHDFDRDNDGIACES